MNPRLTGLAQTGSRNIAVFNQPGMARAGATPTVAEARHGWNFPDFPLRCAELQ